MTSNAARRPQAQRVVSPRPLLGRRRDGGAPPGPLRSWRGDVRGDLGPWPALLGLVLIWAAFQTQNDNYLTPRNLSNLALQIGVVGTLAIGVVLVLLLGEIDLSIAAVGGVCAGLLGVLVVERGWNAWLAIAAALAVGAAIGAVQGLWTVAVGVPSFVVTLAGLLVWQGALLALLGDAGELLIQDRTVRGIASSYLSPAQGWGLAVGAVAIYGADLRARRASRRHSGLPAASLPALTVRIVLAAAAAASATAVLNAYFGVPYVLVILLGLTALLSLVIGRTAFGRHVYAIGGNAEAARRAGIDVPRVRVAVFAIASALGALGGVIGASRAFSVSTGSGGGTLLLDAIAAAVIGGTSLFGGRGQVANALLGALVIGSVGNGLDLLGQPSSTKNIATGLILLVAVSFDALTRRRLAAGSTGGR